MFLQHAESRLTHLDATCGCKHNFQQHSSSADDQDVTNMALSAAQRSSAVASTSQPSQHHPAHAQHSQYHSSHPEHSQQPHGHPGHLHGSQLGQTDAKQAPFTRELEELFAVLSSWLSLRENRQGLPLWQM